MSQATSPSSETGLPRRQHRTGFGRWLCLLLLGACSSQPPALTPAPQLPNGLQQQALEPRGPVRHVLVVSVDGLMPDSYLHPDAHGLKVPTLRRLVASGASSDGALSVFPSLTYPAHTSIASGMLPKRHGVVTNSAFDPLEVNQNAWRWYDVDVKTPRLWDVALAAGYRTAILDWPVTVGESATLHVPEFWRAKVADDVKLIDALSTPGLLQAVGDAYPDFRGGFRPQDVSDEAGMDLAVFSIQTSQPHVLFLHVWQVDAAQHKYGIDSPEARAAIETVDAQLSRLLDALTHAGIADSSVLAVVSDHGFASVERCVNPAYLLRQANLLQADEGGRLTAWEAAVIPAHGVAYVYTRDPNNSDLEARTLQVFLDAQQAGRSGIARILNKREIADLGGDPEALIALEAEAGTYFGTGRITYETPPTMKATHGYAPQQAQMKASLILYGATITHGKIPNARLIDLAPTLAQMLGLELRGTDGKPLTISSGAHWPKASSGSQD